MSVKIVILCGGSGTRLWPESRTNFPKQFIPLYDGKSLFDLTLERLLSLNYQETPIIICNKKHGFFVKNSIKRYNIKADIMLEPEGKNTTAAIYLAAKTSSQDSNLIIMPSDHLIPDKESFVNDINNIKKLTDFNQWITLGIEPSKPSEAYGYIKVSNINKKELLNVIKFVEKPNQKIASQMLKNGNYYWNSGIFLGKASMIINSIKNHALEIADACDNVFINQNISKNENRDEINFSSNLFSKIPSQSIDFSVMEFEKNIKLYPLNSKWSDVGSWDSVSEINEFNSISKNVIQIESSNNFIRNDKRIIATIGVKDLIIIDNDNATLITQKNHSEKVKLIVKELIKNKFTEAEEHTFEERPWGKFSNLLVSKNCKVKQLEIIPRMRLSLQYHNFRSEHWLIILGTAKIHLNDQIIILKKGMSIDIPVKAPHYIHNDTDDPLIIIETQLGEYFGEDDIIRLDDPHNR